MEKKTDNGYDSENDVEDFEGLVESMTEYGTCLDGDDNECRSSLFKSALNVC